MRGSPNIVTSCGPGAPGRPVDLEGHGAAVAQVLDQGQRRERVVADVDDAQPERAARVVLDGARRGVVLGRLDDHDLDAAVAGEQRADHLPPGGVRGHDDEPRDRAASASSRWSSPRTSAPAAGPRAGTPPRTSARHDA